MKPHQPLFQFVRLWTGLLLALLAAPRLYAKIQFDVFAGYGDANSGIVRSGGWFPVSFEVMNDGPSFDAVIEVSSGQLGGQVLKIPVELPTNTRKRIVVPAFSAASSILILDARLLDSSGKVRDERQGLRLNLVTWEVPILGALPATHAGQPSFPSDRQKRGEYQPAVARMQPEFFPDNPIALEGLNAIYLNSARALELKEPQANALLAWLFGGGHLIVSIDQAADFSSAPWLRGVLPADPTDARNARVGETLFRWVSNSDFRPRHGYEAPTAGLEVHQNTQPKTVPGDQDPYRQVLFDAQFNEAEQVVIGLRPRDGKVVIGDAANALAVTAPRGRGQITLLGVNPEREPFKSWKVRPWFFARLCGVSPLLLQVDDISLWGGRGLDSVFGAMIETRQIRKLPVGFLLLLLLVYLVVIGPFDQWWLKKINRPMLTWITFPTYVALFSLLIYFIGFKLRAGQREWAELHVVDVIPQGDGSRSALRGRTFSSIYSPANETYQMATSLPQSAVRSEFASLMGSGIDNGRLTVRPKATGVEAEVFVPVWTSQLNVTEWQDADTSPITATFAGGGVKLVNLTQQRIEHVWVVDSARFIHHFGPVGGGASADLDLSASKRNLPLQGFVNERNAQFQTAVSRRESAFGSNERSHIDDWASASVAASFGSQLGLNNGESRDFVWPSGMDLTGCLSRGDTIVFAWLPDASLIAPINQFEAPRQKKGTLLRLVIPAR